MGSEHIIFIPGTLLVGLVLGYVLGQRAVIAQMAKKSRLRKE